MSQWKEVLWKECQRAYYRGGEVKVTFIRRQEKVIPIVESFIDNQVRCDEETVVKGEED